MKILIAILVIVAAVVAYDGACRRPRRIPTSMPAPTTREIEEERRRWYDGTRDDFETRRDRDVERFSR